MDINYKAKFYTKLCHHYIKRILECRLLLDEDLEVLLNDYDVDCGVKSKKYEISPVAISGMLASVLIYFCRKSCSHKSLSYLPTIIIPSFTIFWEIRNIRRRNKDENNINLLIESLTNYRRVVHSVIEYFKARCLVKSSNFDANNIRIFELYKHVIKTNIGLINRIKEHINSISAKTNCIQEDVFYTNQIELKENLKVEKYDDELRKHLDVIVYISSKTLAYLAICLKESLNNSTDLREIFNYIVPDLINSLNKSCNFVKEEYDKTRYFKDRIEEYKNSGRIVTNKIFSAKLQKALVHSSTNISIILEKSENLLCKIDKITDDKEYKDVGSAILDLRNHTYATYESLDVLCKLYGLFLNLDSTNVNKIIVNQQNSEDKSELPVVNFDDDTEAIEDAKYELFIAEDGEREIEIFSQHEEDQSRNYLSLMVREMQQTLKQHQRFIAAKKRRGSSEESEDLSDLLGKKQKEKTPPKFNLSEVNQSDNTAIPPPPPMNFLCEERLKRVPPPPSMPSVISPPPPPPIQSFSIPIESNQGNSRSLSDNIRALSGQLNVNEEVFGDSESSIDSDDLDEV